MLVVCTVVFSSCKEEKLGDSIFDTTPPVRNKFDQWLYDSITIPYNIQVFYKYEDIEASNQYNLIPADLGNSKKLIQIVKHTWYEAYDEIVGKDFLRAYVPRILQFIGSAAWNDDTNSYVAGTAEGGMKVTLYVVNWLQTTPAFLKDNYLHTMHHEFGHILNQKIAYDPAFKLISKADYIGGDWIYWNQQQSLAKGFITPYSMDKDGEDFVELYSTYINCTAAEWANLMQLAARTNVLYPDQVTRSNGQGRIKIEQKLTILRDYFQTRWNINLDQMREILNRRTNDVQTMSFNEFLD
ncbi:MAG: putative zinc-binding metallopeptidase [Paludibacter sp.]|nr:putative zinc-binding metallopeptidase [Paludibacter sp.]